MKIIKSNLILSIKPKLVLLPVGFSELKSFREEKIIYFEWLCFFLVIKMYKRNGKQFKNNRHE